MRSWADPATFPGIGSAEESMWSIVLGYWIHSISALLTWPEIHEGRHTQGNRPLAGWSCRSSNILYRPGEVNNEAPHMTNMFNWTWSYGTSKIRPPTTYIIDLSAEIKGARSHSVSTFLFCGSYEDLVSMRNKVNTPPEPAWQGVRVTCGHLNLFDTVL
jgi:hypothetical protein